VDIEKVEEVTDVTKRRVTEEGRWDYKDNMPLIFQYMLHTSQRVLRLSNGVARFKPMQVLQEATCTVPTKTL
jgi:hypothetical protein